MAAAEKITIHMNAVEPGKVDFLVEEGCYSNRADLEKHRSKREKVKAALAQAGKII